jgi:uncharacterized membrane protein
MKTKLNKNIVLGIVVIVSFVLLIISVPMYFEYERGQKQFSIDSPDFDNKNSEEISELIKERRGKMPNPFGFVIPFFSFVGLAVGAMVYYIMSDRTEKIEKKIKKTKQAAKHNTKIILKFLTTHERKVVEKLLENNGKMRQYELSYLPELGKLRTHRILVNLERKGVISREKFGKVNKVSLNKELYEVLKN